METAKLLMSGNSQAVRLPKEYRFSGEGGGDPTAGQRGRSAAQGRPLAGDVRCPAGVSRGFRHRARPAAGPGAGAGRVKLLLDTDICIYVINRRRPEALQRLRAYPSGRSGYRPLPTPSYVSAWRTALEASRTWSGWSAFSFLWKWFPSMSRLAASFDAPEYSSVGTTSLSPPMP
jgi:hypothetical protein